MIEQLEYEICGPGAVEAEDQSVEGLYTTSWVVSGGVFIPRPYSNCSTCAPRTNASFRLSVTSPQFAVLTVILDTFDSTGNYPGRKIETISDNIAINPGARKTLRQPGGDCSVALEQVIVRPGVCSMTTGFTAPWKARRDERLCHSGQIVFKRTFNLTRVAREGGDAHGVFA